MSKVDVSKYKEEDITNISKEETPIVKTLNKRQTIGFIFGFVLFILLLRYCWRPRCFAVSYIAYE